MQNIKNLVTISCISAVIGMAALAGCSSTDSSSNDGRSQGRAKDDKRITEAVESKLKADLVYKFGSVSVMTFVGIVQLAALFTIRTRLVVPRNWRAQCPGLRKSLAE